MRIATFDVECTDFSAIGPGFLLCTTIKELDGESSTFRYDSYHCGIGHERDLVRAVNNELRKYDMLIGFNSENFDLRWLFSRSLALDLTFDLNPFSYDLYRASNRLGIKTPLNSKGHPRHSLGFLIDFFGIEQGKTVIYQRDWWQAVWGNVEERAKKLTEICSHCESDVRLTEQLYHRIMPVDKRAIIRRWNV